ncbi:MAG: DUF6382 domain-containing protein [Lachnospiraceae bacterium]|nr:DUF6382 domain-containing protein [Lachnospiraceae bacterium]
MKAEYRRDLQNNYLILQSEEEEEKNSYQLKMAQQNEIAGLLPFHCARKDGELQFYYEITAKQSVSSLYEKRLMGRTDILTLLGGIRDTMENLQKYLLNPLHLVFHPEYIYMDAERRNIFLCYVSQEDQESSILSLAEFILKHLDHEDRCAVVLGYSFYQKASEENFSLYKALRELLLEMRNEEAGADTEAAQTQRAEQDSGRWDLCGNGQTESHKVSADSRTGYDHAYTERMEYEKQNTETYEVTHKQRSGKARKNNAVKKIDWLFRIIHPAMLISGLFLLAVLEIVCYAGGLGITEAGGIFFLILSLELLLNKYLLNRGKKREKEQWLQEEEEEMYRILKDEMYEMPREKERIEQTQYLNNFPENEVLRLISVQAEKGGTIFPDICLDREIVCVGKLKGEVDVILDSPTVSRMHARLERRDGKFFVKDLNSRNGTFHNGRRLAPQEQCEITVGDRISFAEAGYQAVKL